MKPLLGIFLCLSLCSAQSLLETISKYKSARIEILLREETPCKFDYKPIYIKSDIALDCFKKLTKNPIDTTYQYKKAGICCINSYGSILINGKYLCGTRNSFRDSCKYDSIIILMEKSDKKDSTMLVAYNCSSAANCYDKMAWNLISSQEFMRLLGEPVPNKLNNDSLKSYFYKKYNYKFQKLEIHDTSCTNYYARRRIKNY